MKLVINSESSGKFYTENRGGREFMITQMMPIQADSIMNGLLYPARAVMESYPQLNKLPAPAGHPSFNGKQVSAFDPEGAASFNVGAFVRSPEMSGDSVFAELAVDVEVANQSDKGKDILNRIRTGRQMGVSTGLTANVLDTQGRHNDEEYFGVVNQISFDHVAVLLDEPPAGEFTYTLNSSEYFNKPKDTKIMREVTFTTDDLSLDDHKLLENAARDPKAILRALTVKATLEEAEAVVLSNGKHILDAPKVMVDEYIENKDAFADFKKELANKRQEKVDYVVSNSEMTPEMLESMTDETLDGVVNSVAPKNKHIAAFNKQDAVELDLSALEG